MDGSVASRSVLNEGAGVAVGVNTVVARVVAVGLAAGDALGVGVDPLAKVGSGVGAAALVETAWVAVATWVDGPGYGLAFGLG